jgi:hypothetical protein
MDDEVCLRDGSAECMPAAFGGYPKGMSLLRSAVRFARSPQGQRVLAQAKKAASDPKNKEKIEQLRERVAAARRPKP